MKKRLLHKKWNNEVRDLKLQLKRDSIKSHFKTYLSYEHYDGDFTWSDIYFIGTFEGRKRVFNCTIQSSIDEFNNEIDALISNKLDDLYPNRFKNTDIVFEENEESSEKIKLSRIKIIIHDQDLDDKIENSKKELLKQSIINKDIKIKSYVKFLPDYQYGIGLDIITKEKMINEKIILDYVKKIQSMNLTKNLIFLSDEEIEFSESDHYEYTDSNFHSKALITD